jgi:DNA replication protein DnaD
MNDGWIKLYRQALDHWLYNEPRPNTRREAWEDLLLLCNHSDTKVLIHGELIDCKRGQSVMSLKSWAKQFKWSIQQVRTFFKLLEADSMIVVEGLKKTTRVTICKYDEYQNIQHTGNTQVTPQTTTNKKEKE